MSVTNYRYPTFMLADMVKSTGELGLELAINKLTQAPARMHGLTDRGVLAPGSAADVCVIDPQRIALGPPEVVHDLPGGSPRLLQKGFGYRTVLVNGVRAIEEDIATGATSGSVLCA